MRTQELVIKSIGSYLPDVQAAPANAQEGEESRPESMASDYKFESCAVAADIPAADMAVRAAREALNRAGTRVDLHIHTQMFRQGPESFSPAGYILHQLGTSDIPSHTPAAQAHAGTVHLGFRQDGWASRRGQLSRLARPPPAHRPAFRGRSCSANRRHGESPEVGDASALDGIRNE